MPTGKELAAVSYKYLGVSYAVLDCQAFVEECLRDIGISKNLPGSNAWYREMTWVGSPEECRKHYGSIPTGAFLFILSNNGQEPEKYRGDGIGNASHIGLVTNTGLGAIHSSASKGVVCESKFNGNTIPNGGWNRVGLWDRIDYGTKEETPMDAAIVFAENGGDVNMRESPRKTGSLLMRVPTGSVVEVISRGDEWSKVRFTGVTGFMMTEFLKSEDSMDSGDMIQVSRQELLDLYNRLGALIGV